MPLAAAARRRLRPFLLAVAALVAAGCGPVITVENHTRIPVRVFVSNGDRNDLLLPSPGESSTMDAQVGAYGVSAIPDKEWVEYARATRRFLNEQLAQPDSLTGPQLLKVIDRLRDVAAQMLEFGQAARAAGSGCGGMISDQSSGALAVVSIAPDGSLAVTCK